jgi:hypothetical protein
MKLDFSEIMSLSASVLELSSQNKRADFPPSYPRKRVSRSFDFPGFRVALAIAGLPGMIPKLFNGFRRQDTLEPQRATMI